MKRYAHFCVAAVFVAVSILAVAWDAPLAYLQSTLSGMNAVSYLAYVLILTSAVVFMPLTVMPLIPLAAGIMGPFVTAVLSVIGWTLGAGIAFLISRHIGRPLIEKRMNLHKLDSVLEKMPTRSHFWFIVVLRLTLPVDLVSYALGLVKNLNFSSYIAATFVGVVWFSFAFAYLGDAFFKGDAIVFMEVALASGMVFGSAWYFLRLYKDDK
jgi:uncharacterized membrane protein YdjX (TVP38/TMEM64 family)